MHPAVFAQFFSAILGDVPNFLVVPMSSSEVSADGGVWDSFRTSEFVELVEGEGERTFYKSLLGAQHFACYIQERIEPIARRDARLGFFDRYSVASRLEVAKEEAAAPPAPSLAAAVSYDDTDLTPRAPTPHAKNMPLPSDEIAPLIQRELERSLCRRSSGSGVASKLLPGPSALALPNITTGVRSSVSGGDPELFAYPDGWPRLDPALLDIPLEAVPILIREAWEKSVSEEEYALRARLARFRIPSRRLGSFYDAKGPDKLDVYTARTLDACQHTVSITFLTLPARMAESDATCAVPPALALTRALGLCYHVVSAGPAMRSHLLDEVAWAGLLVGCQGWPTQMATAVWKDLRFAGPAARVPNAVTHGAYIEALAATPLSDVESADIVAKPADWLAAAGAAWCRDRHMRTIIKLADGTEDPWSLGGGLFSSANARAKKAAAHGSSVGRRESELPGQPTQVLAEPADEERLSPSTTAAASTDAASASGWDTIFESIFSLVSAPPAAATSETTLEERALSPPVPAPPQKLTQPVLGISSENVCPACSFVPLDEVNTLAGSFWASPLLTLCVACSQEITAMLHHRGLNTDSDVICPGCQTSFRATLSVHRDGGGTGSFAPKSVFTYLSPHHLRCSIELLLLEHGNKGLSAVAVFTRAPHVYYNLLW